MCFAPFCLFFLSRLYFYKQGLPASGALCPLVPNSLLPPLSPSLSSYFCSLVLSPPPIPSGRAPPTVLELLLVPPPRQRHPSHAVRSRFPR